MLTDRLLRFVALAVVALAIPGLTACGSDASTSPAPTQAGGGMGMAAGASEGGMVTGVIAAAREATLTLSVDPVSAKGVTVERVVAPADGWVVVRSAIPPGAVLGRARVVRGASDDVRVHIDGATEVEARIALHIDRGSKGVFEYDPARESRSPDGPVNVDRRPVEVPLVLDDFGAEIPANSVLLLVEDQEIVGDELAVSYLITPQQSWIAVYEFDGGLPGKLIGATRIAAGEFQQIRVPLDAKPTTGQVIVVVHTDRGEPGVFEYSTGEPLGSTDQPFRSAGVIVANAIGVR